jgi:hypothetical protein
LKNALLLSLLLLFVGSHARNRLIIVSSAGHDGRGSGDPEQPDTRSSSADGAGHRRRFVDLRRGPRKGIGVHFDPTEVGNPGGSVQRNRRPLRKMEVVAGRATSYCFFTSFALLKISFA